MTVLADLDAQRLLDAMDGAGRQHLLPPLLNYLVMLFG
jgi:hypothetical protein